MSDISEQDIQITVRSRYIAGQSDPNKDHYVFAYHISITNNGSKPITLMSRRWLIVDAHFRSQEVTGEGVVGRQPRIEPGASFDYSSGCVMETEVGTMEGHYDMVTDDGQSLRVAIAKFVLSAPRVVH